MPLPDAKTTNLLLAASGTILCIMLTMKFHRRIIQKLKSLRDTWRDRNVIQSFDHELNMKTISDSADCSAIVAEIKADCESGNWPVCGFDCEWITVAGKRQKVALLQLCSPKGLCALIRLCKLNTYIPPELRNFLENPRILKVGVTPLSDAKYLLQDYKLSTTSTLDLRYLGLLAKPSNTGSLAKLSRAILNIALDKDWRLVCSDWEVDSLTYRQESYAAHDAYVAMEIFRKLYSSIQKPPESPEEVLQFCENYLDRAYKNKLTVGEASGNLTKGKNGVPKQFKRSYGTRASPLYHNCHLQAPDGELLCTIDRKKAEWYVKNNLGTEISNDPAYIVRLNFEPSGRARGEVGEYYRSVKENKCVVCGSKKDLVRKNVVPHEYRKYFPLVMKAKTSHDVVLLCVYCHQLSNIKDLEMRQKLELECDAPLRPAVSPENLEANKSLRQDKRTARALLEQTKIPEWRRRELKENLAKSYPNEEITEEFLKALLLKEEKSEHDQDSSHAKIVVDDFIKRERLTELERMWRQHFLNEMSPLHLPKLWDVKHNENRLEIRASEGRVTAEELRIAGVVIQDESQAPLETENDQNDSASNSEWEYASAAGSEYSQGPNNLDRTLTGDDRYFSDVTSMQSFYETVRSDGSTLDDFQSFASSLTERPGFDSDFSGRTTPSAGSDTEVEDHVEASKPN